MELNACLQGVIDAAKGKIEEKDMKQFIKRVKKTVNRKQIQYVGKQKVRVKDDIAIQNAIADYHGKVDDIIDNMEYNAKLNAIRKNQAQNYIGDSKDPAGKLYSYLISDRQSVGYRQLTYTNTFLGMLQSGLKKEELTTLQDGQADIKIADDAAFHNSDDKTIKNINQTLENVFEDMRKRFNAAGAMIAKLKGRLFRQAHDPDKLMQIDVNPAAEMNKVQQFFAKFGRAMSPEERFNLAFNQWKSFTEPRVNKVMSGIFNLSEDEKDNWFREFFTDNASNVHTTLEQSAPGVFHGSNMLKRLDAEKVMVFNTPKDNIEYAKKYGYGTIYQNVIKNIEKASKDLALLEVLGSNPEHMFESIKNELIDKNKENPDMVKKLKGRKLQAAWETVSGHYKMANSNGMAKAFANVRALVATAKFGTSNATAFTMDPLGRAASLKTGQGVPWLKAMFQGYTESLKYVNADRAEIKNFTNAYVRHTLGGIQSRLGMDTMPAKIVANLQDLTFKINGLHALDQARSEGVVMAEGNSMANNLRNKNFSQLNESTRQMYKTYGIDEAEYNALKNATFKVDGDTHYIFPDSIAKMKDEDIQEYASAIGKSIYNARNDLQFKVANYQRDAVGNMIMDARDPTMRMIYNFFGGPGTLGGEIMRTALLGKAWGVQYTYRIIDPLLSKGTWGSRIGNAATLVLFSTMASYLNILTHNFYNGKKPDDWTDWHSWYKAFAESGALGQYSDVLFQYIEHPDKLVPLAMEELYKLLKVPYDAYNASPGKRGQVARKELYNWAVSNAPMINLPLVKLVLDHAILYKAQDAMEPGSVEKLQYNTQKNGGKYWWAPTSPLPNFMK